MKTIFDLNVTREESQVMDKDYYGTSVDTYLEDLKKRAEHNNTSVEFEATCDLQELAQIRKDESAYEKYTLILTIDMADIYNRVFPE